MTKTALKALYTENAARPATAGNSAILTSTASVNNDIQTANTDSVQTAQRDSDVQQLNIDNNYTELLRNAAALSNNGCETTRCETTAPQATPEVNRIAPSNMAAPSAMEGMLATMHTMTQTMMSLQQTVLTLMTNKESQRQPTNDYTLDTAYASLRRQDTTNSGGCPANLSEGIASGSIPHIDVVSDQNRKKILEGKYVNLASLLIPKYETERPDDLHRNLSINLYKESEDPRLNKTLSIAEFITAFGKFKRVMCEKFPERRDELDIYEANIIQVHNVYGQRFYDYHCQFAMKAAAALRNNNQKVRWELMDHGLLSMVVGNTKVNTCQLCGLTSHSTPFCPQQRHKRNSENYGKYYSAQTLMGKQSKSDKDTDRLGRPKIKINGAEVCNNFNEGMCQFGSNCVFTHICLKCRASSHGAKMCRKTNKSLQEDK